MNYTPHRQAPCNRGTAHIVYPIRASQERLRGPPHQWEKRQGETSPEEDGVENSPWSCPSPPEATYSNPAEMVRYGLEVAAWWCAKGTWVHPPALYHGRDTLLQKAFLPRGVQNNSQTARKVMLRMVSSKGESKQSGHP